MNMFIGRLFHDREKRVISIEHRLAKIILRARYQRLADTWCLESLDGEHWTFLVNVASLSDAIFELFGYANALIIPIGNLEPPPTDTGLNRLEQDLKRATPCEAYKGPKGWDHV